MTIGAGLFGALLLGNAATDPARVDRARANYELLLSGQVQVSQLTPQELADVVDFDRALRDHDDRPRSQRCVDDEVARAGGSPSRLAREVIDLKCRELGAGFN